ncbi:MAG: hypothetical protein WDM80_07475 [Limisphaerales bacterium]
MFTTLEALFTNLEKYSDGGKVIRNFRQLTHKTVQIIDRVIGEPKMATKTAMAITGLVKD